MKSAIISILIGLFAGTASWQAFQLIHDRKAQEQANAYVNYNSLIEEDIRTIIEQIPINLCEIPIFSNKGDYGIDTDYTFLETNERLDAIRSQLPVAGVSIRTAKAKATDLPVMLIQVTENSSDVSRSDKRQMSDVVDNVVRRRLEQLPDVSMVDITGTVQPQISLYPDLQRLSQCNLTVADIMQALSRAGSANSTVGVIDGGRVCHLNVNNSQTSHFSWRE
ncbi:MAG TPA: hypothetical protein DCE24_08140 [Porphyromonadaceae bacterium]|nr:efflux RND transporter permease subunit [Paramuribaculum sp.]HAB41811.1 hypothetical protein [Porphyromonadaceae bacterium]